MIFFAPIALLMSRLLASRAATTAASTSFSSAAAKGANFGAILAGRMTQAQAVQNQQQQNAQSGISSFGSSVGKNPTAMTLGVVGAFGALTIAGKKLADSQVEAQRSLAKFNGTIAVAYAKLARNDILRDRASSAATAESTKTLTEAQDAFKEELRPLKDITQNIYNELAAKATMLLTAVIIIAKHIPGIAGAIKQVEDEMKKKKGQRGIWQDALNDLANRHRDKNDPAKRRRGGP